MMLLQNVHCVLHLPISICVDNFIYHIHVILGHGNVTACTECHLCFALAHSNLCRQLHISNTCDIGTWKCDCLYRMFIEFCTCQFQVVQIILNT